MSCLLRGLQADASERAASTAREEAQRRLRNLDEAQETIDRVSAALATGTQLDNMLDRRSMPAFPAAGAPFAYAGPADGAAAAAMPFMATGAEVQPAVPDYRTYSTGHAVPPPEAAPQV